MTPSGKWSPLNQTNRWQLLKVLTVSSWRSRYRNSILGFAWGILEPLSLTAMFVIVFSILTRGIYEGEAPYPVFVLLGTILWSLFAQGTTQGGNGVLMRSALAKQIYFPREYLSYSYILTILVTTGVNLGVFAMLHVAYGVTLAWTVLLFPLILGILLVLVVGTSLLLACIFVRVEDFRYLWQLMITLGLFASPVIYEATVMPSQYTSWYALNPMVGILNGSRDVLIFGVLPSLESILYPTLLAVVLLGIGYAAFRRSEHLFAERL